MIVLIIMSFFQFYKETFSYTNDYYKIKEYCYEKNDINHEYCKVFKDDETLKKYIENSAPQKIYKQYDTITLTCSIIQHTVFNVMQYFSPLLIAIIVLGTIHNTFSSGMFENYLMQINYKLYLKKFYLNNLKVAVIIPMSLILIFIISSILTGFNFDISYVDVEMTVYNEWKYNNFLLYGLVICLIQFLISLFYINIALYCCKKNKNKLVAIIMSYISFIVIDIIIYIGIYCIFLNKIFNIKNMTDYFNIAGYWYFNDNPSHVGIVLLITIILYSISFILLYKSYKNKEKVILSYEEQVS